jgi:glycosyltransferase involved in cell wall biosynthesis
VSEIPKNFTSVTPTVLTYNSEKHLQEVLGALRPFETVIVVDSGSSDKTESIARSFSNVRFYSHPFEGYGLQHQHAESLAPTDWIFSIDSDEVATPELVDEIAKLDLDSRCIYRIRFDNVFNGKTIRCCGWYPDTHLRLYDKSVGGFGDQQVHEKLRTDGLKICDLRGKIRHYSYDSIDDFLLKMRRYSELFAQQHRCKRGATVTTAIVHGLFAFVKSYFLQRGIICGYEGFIISSYNAQTAFWKYLRLREYNRSCS